MGHGVGKDIHHHLGKKLDGLTVRTPWNDTLHEILRELYSTEEADVVVKMPYALSSLEKISKSTGYEKTRLKDILKGLCLKGLVIDLENKGEPFYMSSPMVVGVFEFTMMRSGAGLDRKKVAGLFHTYFETFIRENFRNGGIYNILRVIPYEDQVAKEDYVTVMDYEKASEIVNQNNKFSIGLCSCRHEKHHRDEKKCDTPLEVCTAFGVAADYLIRNNLARECSKTEMQELIAYAKVQGLVYSADNVQKGLQNICLCCGCCCNYLSGITQYGIAHSVLTSNYIARVNDSACIGCGKCAKACPIEAIKMVPVEASGSEKKKKRAVIDTSFCIGCGVCASKCKQEAISLVKREKRRITPETTFHKNILQSLERGTLQNLIFNNPQNSAHNFLRGLVGGFLQLDPVKRALMSDTLRSQFLKGMEVGMKAQGMGWVVDL